MNDHGHIIQHHPARLTAPFGLVHFDTLIPEFVDNIICHRAKVNVCVSRTNHEIIGYRRERTQVQNVDVSGFFIAGELPGRYGQLFWCNCLDLLSQMSLPVRAVSAQPPASGSLRTARLAGRCVPAQY